MKNDGGGFEQLKEKDKHKVCWQAVPCKYDAYDRDAKDPYDGDVFGRLSLFESPHRLYRHFHRNFCRALITSNLVNYEMVDTEDNRLLSQVERISEQFAIDGIARHNSLVLLIGAVETFLKDSFIMILEHVYPKKKGRKDPEKIARGHSFQNLDSVTRAYEWLCPEFDKCMIYWDKNPDDFNKEINLYPLLKEMIDRRHRIVHEAHYYEDMDYDRLMFYAHLCNMWADKFDWFFEDNSYYRKIDVYVERPRIRDKRIQCPECGSVDCIPVISDKHIKGNQWAAMNAFIKGRLKLSEKPKQKNGPEWFCNECSLEW